ncbi:ABC transporter ATP-binding protein [Paralimibaculum aggregatum]|uniref:ABC transporter ATP-binding protein n=1 Tax=Paralimibaculum aggregatum TaxID=3036245 RepID=A0ABQ6LTA4_9RHOB|nr:ABC transporter ATP-binding protein [Limibaculum sp. NKW23]GMG85309.1 ABC transporter ATP-binding protein [Limibaculum sp. NKW23]
MTLELRQVALEVGGETHIHPTDLRLERGGFNILLGTTRAGKTTLMHLMAGLERPTAGQVWFEGRDVTGISVRRRNVAMVHQQFINYPSLSVFENIASPLRVARMARAEIDARVREAADLLKLTPMLGRRPDELSGGQQQRTAIARALVKDADLVLLDEPLANLDYKLREELREELPRLFEAKGAVVVYATTEPSEALLLAGHTATLHEGRVTGFGPTGALYRAPGDLLTAQVFSEPPINLGRVEKRGGRVALAQDGAALAEWDAPAALSEAADGTYTMGLRPHFVQPANGSGLPEVEGRVLVTELSGSESVAHFELAGQPWVSQAHGIHPFEVGLTARFALETARAFYFDGAGRRVGS